MDRAYYGLATFACVSMGLCFYYYLIFDFISVDLFIYPDFKAYQTNDFFSPNFLYGYVVRSLGLELDHMPVVAASLAIHFLFISTIVRYFADGLSTIGFGVFLTLVSLNPFIAASAFVFDTMVFVKLFVLLALMLDQRKIDARLFVLTIFFLAMFRFSILLLGLPIILWLFVKRDISRIFLPIAILFYALITLAQGGYLDNFAKSVQGFNWDEETFNLFAIEGLDALSWFIVYALKLMLVLGGREAMYTEGLAPFLHEGQFVQILLAAGLAAVNLFGSWLFLRSQQFSTPLKLSFCILLLGSLVTVSHARYTFPFMPLLALSITFWIQERNLWRLNRLKT